jgi:hypothetical protein
MKKIVISLVFFASLMLCVSCGTGETHDSGGGDGGGGTNPTPGTLNLNFRLADTYAGTDLYCTGPSLAWPENQNQAPDFTDNTQGQSVVNLTNQTAGQYWCNANDAGQWLASNGTVFTNMVVNGYTLTATDTESNGIGIGGNWTFILEDDGTIRCAVNCGGVVPPPPTCDPLNPPATIDVPVIFKSYDSLTYTPQVTSEVDNWVPHAMTPVSANMFTYTYNGVPTNLPYTINFINPTTGEELYNESGPVGSYLTIVNGVQVNEMMGNDIWMKLDVCGVPDVNYHDLVFNWTPSDPSFSLSQLIFGQHSFNVFPMTQAGNDWTATLDNIAPGRYEANISYLPAVGLPNVAVWPNSIDGTITINGTVMNTNFIIDYGQIVQMPDPTNPNMIYLLQANLIFDLMPDGSVVGVNIGDPIIIIIIPVP